MFFLCNSFSQKNNLHLPPLRMVQVYSANGKVERMVFLCDFFWYNPMNTIHIWSMYGTFTYLWWIFMVNSMIQSTFFFVEAKATRRYVQWVGDVRAKVRRGWRYVWLKVILYI